MGANVMTIFNFKNLSLIIFAFSFLIETQSWAKNLSIKNPTTEQLAFLTQLEPLEDAKYIVTPDGDHNELIAAFDSAKKSIQVGIFGISDVNIGNSLVAAQKRGVQVTVICDSYCDASPSRKAISDQLKAAGVAFYTASSGFNITHWKMFVIDEEYAFISTMNFITRFKQMRDMGVFVKNPSIIKEILSVYKADIENSKNKTSITPELRQPNLVWSPVNAEYKLTELINSAQSSIEIWIENLGNDKIQTALQQAAARQVKVRILTSMCGMGGAGSTTVYQNFKNLIAAGIQLQVMPFPANAEAPYIHAKTINVDHKNIYLGSENFSNNSLLSSRELGLIFNHPAIESQMSQIYESDWKHSVPLPETPPTKCVALTPSSQ